MQVVQSSSSSNEPTQQVLLFETLPPIFVLNLEHFLYDAATEGINKISKSVQFAPELEISIRTLFSFVSPCTAKNFSCLISV